MSGIQVGTKPPTAPEVKLGGLFKSSMLESTSFIGHEYQIYSTRNCIQALELDAMQREGELHDTTASCAIKLH